MPTYDYECPSCGDAFERVLPLAEYNTPQTCECGSQAVKVISAVGFVLKGDDWPGKNLRVKQQMAAKNKILSKKQEERKRDAPGVKLAPNVGGERVDSWSDAQKLAASKGLNASSYASKVAEERSKR